MLRIVIVLSLCLTIAACADASAPAPTPTPPESVMTDVPLISDQPAPGADAEQAARPEWQRLALTDVRTGQTFTFADFAGSTVFVHPMATWCTNCRVSQRNLQGAVMPELQGENVVFISIDVQTALSDAELLTYTQNEGFDWRFAVATPELITALVQVFGLSIGNPPSQPHFIIRPDGTTTALLLGNPPPDETLQRIRAESGA